MQAIKYNCVSLFFRLDGITTHKTQHKQQTFHLRIIITNTNVNLFILLKEKKKKKEKEMEFFTK